MKKPKNPMEVEAWSKARDQFAAAALTGMLASAPMCDRTAINKAKWSKIAFEWADAMLKVRES